MIISLTLKCFRKHLDRVFNFTDGLNAIRGANEDGKTSMLIGILYALYGSKALPLPLEETVTYGYPVKDLKASLIISINGEMYNFIRGKAGAECKHSGGIVTGQNEVSKFAAELLGADLDKAQKLMFSTQNGLRGALDNGATALSAYIEDLSGMDLFDYLLDAAGTEWPTGPTTTLDNRVAVIEENLKIGAPVLEDLSQYTDQIVEADNKRKAKKEELPALRATATAAADAYNQASVANTMRQTAQANLQRAISARDRKKDQLDELNFAGAAVVDLDRISHLQQVVNDQSLIEKALVAHAEFKKLVYPEAFWEGTADSLTAEIAAESAKGQAANLRISGLKSDIREAKAKMVNSATCGYCAKDFSEFPEVAKKNKELADQITCWTAGIEADAAIATEALATGDDLREVKELGERFDRFANRYPDYVTADTSVVPTKLAWKGAVPVAMEGIEKLHKELVQLVAAEKARDAAVAQLPAVKAELQEFENNVKLAQEAVPGVVDVAPLLLAKQEAEEAVQQVVDYLATVDAQIHRLSSTKSQVVAVYEQAKRNYEGLQAELVNAKKDREELVFHNGLVKKIKGARPIVASKLWTIVLASVSTMFSKMRGEQSIVAREADGFTVNGKAAKGVSGSTLDILGMAMRVALLKTFIPDCPFMILDEPMAACDDNRTAAMLGFLNSCGFQQVLLVTHEDMSETCASNLVLL